MTHGAVDRPPGRYGATKRQLWALGVALAAYYPVVLATEPSNAFKLLVPVAIDSACFVLIWRGKGFGWWFEIIRQGASMWLALLVPSFFDSRALAIAALVTGAAALAALLWIRTPRVPDLT